jgi:hypothetical protein
MSQVKSVESVGSVLAGEGGGGGSASQVEGSSSQGEMKKDGGIDVLFDQLGLEEADFDDFVIDDQEEMLMEGTRWMAVARVQCCKNFSHEALFQQMQNAWNPA